MKNQETTHKLKLKKDDPVIVVRGKRVDKGKIGKIMRIIPDKERVVVEKVHVVKEYVRANPQKNIQGGIVDREGSIPLSSVMYYCRDCEQGVRIGYQVISPDSDNAAGTAKTANSKTGKKAKGNKDTKDAEKTGRLKSVKQRICKKCGVVLD